MAADRRLRVDRMRPSGLGAAKRGGGGIEGHLEHFRELQRTLSSPPTRIPLEESVTVSAQRISGSAR